MMPVFKMDTVETLLGYGRDMDFTRKKWSVEYDTCDKLPILKYLGIIGNKVGLLIWSQLGTIGKCIGINQETPHIRFRTKETWHKIKELKH